MSRNTAFFRTTLALAASLMLADAVITRRGLAIGICELNLLFRWLQTAPFSVFWAVRVAHVAGITAVIAHLWAQERCNAAWFLLGLVLGGETVALVQWFDAISMF